MEEKELVRLSQEGDEEAFGVLVNKYKTKVFHLTFSMTRNHDLADDLAQEAFIKAYLALNRFKSQSKFGTWLYRIAVNHVRDYLRKKGRLRLIPLEETKEIFIIQEDNTVKKEKEKTKEQMEKLVHQALKTLPEKHQIIISLRDLQGFSYGEISETLGISPGTVDSRLHRARKMLRTKMEHFLSPEGGSDEM